MLKGRPNYSRDTSNPVFIVNNWQEETRDKPWGCCNSNWGCHHLANWGLKNTLTSIKVTNSSCAPWKLTSGTRRESDLCWLTATVPEIINILSIGQDKEKGNEDYWQQREPALRKGNLVHFGISHGKDLIIWRRHLHPWNPLLTDKGVIFDFWGVYVEWKMESGINERLTRLSGWTRSTRGWLW